MCSCKSRWGHHGDGRGSFLSQGPLGFQALSSPFRMPPMITPMLAFPPLAHIRCQAQGLPLGGRPPAHSSSFSQTHTLTHSHACRISILNQLYRPSLISFQGRALEPSAGLVCALKITVSEVMNGTAFALLFLPERGGLNRVGE